MTGLESELLIRTRANYEEEDEEYVWQEEQWCPEGLARS